MILFEVTETETSDLSLCIDKKTGTAAIGNVKVKTNKELSPVLAAS